ncbi:MAG TPA: apolipoprotein N-acyltransferase [Cytophagaceae bacterium]
MRIKESPFYLFLLSMLSGFLFWLGWPDKPLSFFLFLAFVPLLMVESALSERAIRRKGRKFLLYTYIALLTWNVLTTYWVYNATPAGGIFAMTVNALLMCIPLQLFYFTKRYTNNFIGYSSFIVYYLAFEYWHLNWELSWPWLTLGNGFASLPILVQWYEYTGVLGGSLWVLLVNVLLFLTLRFYLLTEKKEFKKYLSVSLALLLVPSLFSVIRYKTYVAKGKEVDVVVVQPDIDPYNEKFPGNPKFIPYEQQFQRLISLSEQKLDSATDYLVWPETALPVDVYEPEIYENNMVSNLSSFVKKYPGLSIVTGLDSYTIYDNEEEATPTARFSERLGYYDVFNSAMQVNNTGKIVLYHKSKLVPGVEQLPYPNVFGVLTKNLGGIVGTLGRQEERTVFFNEKNIGIAPVICYESIFGEFVGEYVKNGAELIFIITNDGWWGNTQGHKQHLQYASLRAIEARKSIARSANTGISGFIDQKGEILVKNKYWEQDVLKAKLRANDVKTFYTRHGDYIGRWSLYITIVLVVYAIVKRFKYRKTTSAF